MPEAAVDENCQASLHKVEIWLAAYFPWGQSPSANASPHEGAAKPIFGGLVTASADSPHPLRAFLAYANKAAAR